MELLYKKYVKETLDKNGYLKDIEFCPSENFNFAYDVVDKLGAENPEKTAMVWVSVDKEEKIFSFADMKKYSAKTANYFYDLGIRKGDRVMLILKRHYQFWFSVLALHKIGAIVIPATNQLTKKDLVYRVNVSGTKAIICTSDGEVSKYVDEAQPETPSLTIKSMVKGSRDDWGDFDSEIEKRSDVFNRPSGENDVTNNDIMLMYFTSGTTGYPKMAAQSYTYPLGHIVTAKYWHKVDPNGIHFTVSDTGWGKAVWGKIYGQWLCEAAIFTYDFDRFDANDLLSVMEKYNITTFCAPPTIYRFFIKEDLSKYNLKSLKHATIAGEALNPEVYNQFLNATGLKLMEGFGQTETTLVVANLIGMEPKPGSMGRPNPQYAVDIVDENGNSVKAGESGEIVLRTNIKKPCGMFMGYYQNEERTNAAWYNDMYHTGDVAWLDEDGYYWYVGRTDDLIKSSGYRIGPFEIESVLMEHPAVLECAVTGVPDELRGQAVKATIVLAKGFEESKELLEDIQNHVKNLTAPYKYPRVVEFVKELPKTISGKIRRVEIREKSE